MSAVMAEPRDAGSARFDPSNLEFTSVDVGNPTVNVIPAEARARFNIRFNDPHTQTSLKALGEARPPPACGRGASRAGAPTADRAETARADDAGAARRHFRIEWEP